MVRNGLAWPSGHLDVLDDRDDRVVLFGARDSACVLGGEEPALAVDGVAVRVPARGSKRTYAACPIPALELVRVKVAEEKIAAVVRPPGGALGEPVDIVANATKQPHQRAIDEAKRAGTL
jgi:hypothetical protein